MNSLVLVSPVFQDYVPEFLLSMNSTFRAARARGWTVGGTEESREPEFLYVQGSMLVEARNTLAQQVLEHTTAAWIVWADADMEWDGDTVMRMADAGEDVVGVSAPSKDGGFVFVGRQGVWDARGLMEVEAIGFGLVVMRRHVLEFFHNQQMPMFREEAGVFTVRPHIGEDICFSRDWCRGGGKLFLMTDANVGHLGRIKYNGNFASQQIRHERQDRRR